MSASSSSGTAALGDGLTERRGGAMGSHRFEAGVDEHAAALADVEGFDSSSDLRGPGALHPLVAAAVQATKEAKLSL
ncbi:hypothetical protein ACFQ6E_38170 [Streptomyces sp. NPDC056462]|uniref:hypothetical protein n=1 Tax=Streptomyces sp. NPDC056462 TaxID=3345826 RepID=UPI003685A182